MYVPVPVLIALCLDSCCKCSFSQHFTEISVLNVWMRLIWIAHICIVRFDMDFNFPQCCIHHQNRASDIKFWSGVVRASISTKRQQKNLDLSNDGKIVDILSTTFIVSWRKNATKWYNMMLRFMIVPEGQRTQQRSGEKKQ